MKVAAQILGFWGGALFWVGFFFLQMCKDQGVRFLEVAHRRRGVGKGWAACRRLLCKCRFVPEYFVWIVPEELAVKGEGELVFAENN